MGKPGGESGGDGDEAALAYFALCGGKLDVIKVATGIAPDGPPVQRRLGMGGWADFLAAQSGEGAEGYPRQEFRGGGLDEQAHLLRCPEDDAFVLVLTVGWELVGFLTVEKFMGAGIVPKGDEA